MLWYFPNSVCTHVLVIIQLWGHRLVYSRFMGTSCEIGTKIKVPTRKTFKWKEEPLWACLCGLCVGNITWFLVSVCMFVCAWHHPERGLKTAMRRKLAPHKVLLIWKPPHLWQLRSHFWILLAFKSVLSLRVWFKLTVSTLKAPQYIKTTKSLWSLRTEV